MCNVNARIVGRRSAMLYLEGPIPFGQNFCIIFCRSGCGIEPENHSAHFSGGGSLFSERNVGSCVANSIRTSKYRRILMVLRISLFSGLAITALMTWVLL